MTDDYARTLFTKCSYYYGYIKFCLLDLEGLHCEVIFKVFVIIKILFDVSNQIFFKKNLYDLLYVSSALLEE
jgi:hypothetical protein